MDKNSWMTVLATVAGLASLVFAFLSGRFLKVAPPRGLADPGINAASIALGLILGFCACLLLVITWLAVPTLSHIFAGIGLVLTSLGFLLSEER